MIIKRRPQKHTPKSEEEVTLRSRRPHKYQEPFDKLNSNQAKDKLNKKPTLPSKSLNRPSLDYDYYDDEDVRVVGNTKDQEV